MGVSDKIQIIHGDITKVKVDAIVNAANNTLLGGFGVDGAIHRAGGSEILEACKKIGGCETGKAVITTAGKLPARYVIHTVGPVWFDGHNNEAEMLSSCYYNSLKLAIDNGCKTIAFPNISTGAYGFPKREAARIAVHTVKKFLEHHDQIDQVLFVCFTRDNTDFTNSALGDATSD
jgi:O-acetyl-ADP-ribose deacetylase (regulator of RNase III)